MQRRRFIVLASCAVVAASATACKQEERNRPTSYTKGEYVGQKGSALTPEQQDSLRRRNRLQATGGL